jgi:hypothetical protein
MATFKMPLSETWSSINPGTALFNPIGSQLGVINIKHGQSSDPDVEQEVLSDVGTDGKQIGRISDALIVLFAHFQPRLPLTPEASAAIDALKEMLNEVATVRRASSRDGGPYARCARAIGRSSVASGAGSECVKSRKFSMAAGRPRK